MALITENQDFRRHLKPKVCVRRREHWLIACCSICTTHSAPENFPYQCSFKLISYSQPSIKTKKMATWRQRTDPKHARPNSARRSHSSSGSRTKRDSCYSQK